jgi:hypothetical protein
MGGIVGRGNNLRHASSLTNPFILKDDILEVYRNHAPKSSSHLRRFRHLGLGTDA